jgi:hypothetical protein
VKIFRLLLCCALIALFNLDATAAPTTACKPASPVDIRVGTTINPDGTANGAWAYWWCIESSTSRVYYEWRAIPAKSLSSSLIAQIRAYVSGSSADIWSAPIASAENDPALSTMKTDIAKAAAADTGKPVPPKWVVSSLGLVAGATDRPAFPVISGKRSTSSKSRATVGSPCDCNAIKIVEGKSLYCQVAPATVSICVAAPVPVAPAPPASSASMPAPGPALANDASPPLVLMNLPGTTAYPVPAPITYAAVPAASAASTVVSCRLVRGPSATVAGVTYEFAKPCPQPFTISPQPVGTHRVDFIIDTGAATVSQKSWTWKVLPVDPSKP